MIFNQFEEFGNSIWHYHVTGSMIREIFEQLEGEDLRLSAYVSATGSGGTIAAGDYLKTVNPNLITTAAEALQCPTLYAFGFGGHRIEGIGDKHVPWIHNVRNTDMVCAVDDQQCMDLLRLFNEEPGREVLAAEGVDPRVVDQLPLLGISSICNLVTAIKTARYYGLDGRDVIFTSLTDSAEMYGSRLQELNAESGPYTRDDALRHQARWLAGVTTDHMRELGFQDRRELHNFKYFTWVEQQGRTVDELRRLWDPDFWTEVFASAASWDPRIEEFNALIREG